MARIIPTILLLWLSLAPGSTAFAAENVEKVYSKLCASCHGGKFEGGLGGDLTDGVWKHGGSDSDIFQSIAKGHPSLGMQAFEKSLSPDQIRALVVFLREKEKAAKYRNAKFPKPASGEVANSQHEKYRLEVLVKGGLEIPWALSFLPDGRKLVTERPGRLRIIDADWKLLPEPVAGTPPVVHHGQGGLMEVAIHPDYEKNGWIYLGIADGSDKKGKVQTLTAVVRGRLDGARWVDQQWIYRADRKFYTGAGVHFGTKFVFAEGYLFFVVGERGGMMEVQDVTRPNGKVFRLFDDGRVPPDNPFVDRPGAIPGIWSYGHRNPQGMAMDRSTGRLYATEHGPRGGDEFNEIVKGGNYGWPVATFGMNYNGTPITSETSHEGMKSPMHHWTPSIAPSGLDWYGGVAFPKWKGDFFAGSLRSEELHRLRVRDGKVTEDEVVLKNIGRIRDVRVGPDGFVYLVLNDPDQIARLVPANTPRPEAAN